MRTVLRVWLGVIVASSVLAAGKPKPQDGGTKPAPAVATTRVGQSFPPIARLEAGRPIEREIAGADEQVYQIALKAGEYAGLTVEQRGIDVVVRVRDSSGRLLGEFDAESRKEGKEAVSLVAASTDEYRVAVRARYTRDPAAHYEIRVDDIRSATDKDRDLFDASVLSTEESALEAAAKYNEALKPATRALELAERAAGSNDAYVGYLLVRLAELRRTTGDRTTAEQLFLRAVAVDEAALGRDHLQTANAMVRLAALYNAAEEFGKAEPLLQEALANTERSLGPVHPRVVLCLMVMSATHSQREDFERAVPELERALTIAERTLEPDDFTLLAILANLGDLYALQKDFDRGEPLLMRSLQGIERIFGPDHPRVAVVLQNLGTIARDKKQYARALEILWRAESIREKAFGTRNTQTASLLINIGNVYHDQGDEARAQDAFERALGVLETAAGPYHSLTLAAVSSLARTFTLNGDTARALEYRARVDRILEKNIDLNLALGSEREKLAYLRLLSENTSRTLSLHERDAPADVSATELAATVILQRKGRVLDEMSGSLAALRQRMNAGDQAVLDRLGAATSRLATLALEGPGRAPFAEYQQRLASLEEQRETLEAEVSQRSAAFRVQSLPVTLHAVEAAVPAHAALVEFAVFRPFNPHAAEESPEAFGESRYIAYVVRQDGGVRWKELGPTKDIDAAAAALREALRDPKRTDVRARAREVDRQVMQPVRPLTGDATQLLLSPDGELNLIPFEALVDERGRYLVERYAISYLTTGRDLLRLRVARASHSDPVVVADPSFGEPRRTQTAHAAAPNAKLPSTNTARRSITIAGDLASVYFAPLAGTGHEARAIKSLFPDARVLTGPEASKAALTRLDAPSILHIATHGFFLLEAERQVTPAAAAAANRTRAIVGAVAIQNPLLRSGLALSGANVNTSGTDGGILTALEASNLNLWGTKLVTLSACDTGVGEIRSGEGVYGLRRAFFLAGAETLVMSLWPVSDYITREVMTGYYSGLKRGLGRGDALRQSQLAMLARSNRQHPFYWASFIQAGEWANLDGQR